MTVVLEQLTLDTLTEVNEPGKSAPEVAAAAPRREESGPGSLTFRGLSGPRLDRAWREAGQPLPVPFGAIPF